MSRTVLFEASVRFRVVEMDDGRTAIEGKLLTDELAAQDPSAPGINLSAAALLALTAYHRFETGTLLKDMQLRFGIDTSQIKKETPDAAKG